MTPKEKAYELVQKMRVHSPVWEIEGDAKQCALIAVDLALEFCGGKDVNEEFDKVLYLVEVKHEIEKI